MKLLLSPLAADDRIVFTVTFPKNSTIQAPQTDS